MGNIEKLGLIIYKECDRLSVEYFEIVSKFIPERWGYMGSEWFYPGEIEEINCRLEWYDTERKLTFSVYIDAFANITFFLEDEVYGIGEPISQDDAMLEDLIDFLDEAWEEITEMRRTR
jgi:hypothetical protein